MYVYLPDIGPATHTKPRSDDGRCSESRNGVPKANSMVPFHVR